MGRGTWTRRERGRGILYPTIYPNNSTIRSAWICQRAVCDGVTRLVVGKYITRVNSDRALLVFVFDFISVSASDSLSVVFCLCMDPVPVLVRVLFTIPGPHNLCLFYFYKFQKNSC